MKKVFITGGRSGIIKSVIDKIKNDYNIYLSVHTLAEFREVRRIYGNYSNIRCFKLDLTSDYDLKSVSDLNIDILICNGAVMESGTLFDMPFDKIKYNFDVNYFGNLRLIRCFIKNNNKLKIIIMSSLGSKIPMPFCGAYSSSKAALSQMVKAFRYECMILKKNIKVVLIEPGLYKTGFNENGFNKKYDYFDYNDNVRMFDNFILKFQKKNLSSISNKIVKAIETENSKNTYRSPFLQALFVKIYNLFS